MGSEPVRAGVLSFHDSKERKAICNAVEALGHESEWIRERNTVVHVRDGDVTLEPDVDVVVNRMLLSATAQPAEELGIANTLATLRPTLNPPAATALASHKIAAAVRLVHSGVPVPETVLALDGPTLNRYRDRFGPEAVFKTAIGTHGGGAWKVRTDDTLSPKVGQRRAFLQALINRNDQQPSDLRVYVVDDSIIAAMYRHAAEGDWRTNVARGGSVEDATDRLPSEVSEMARKATAAVGLDYAGVDLIEGEDGWYVLEVNPTAGFKGLFRATGRSPAPYIAKLAIERGGGTVDEARVDELAATLDDSLPSGESPEPAGTELPIVIGSTERVVVSGTSGMESVIARVDPSVEVTSVDLRLAAEIGAGPIHLPRHHRSNEKNGDTPPPVVDLVLGIGGIQHTVDARVEDRAIERYPLLLGGDVAKHFEFDDARRTEEPETGTPDSE